MPIQKLTTPTRQFGQLIPVAPDTNAEVAKINELVDALNEGLGTSNALVGGSKYVRYLDSRTYGVGVADLTLDRLDAATILPGNRAVVLNPSDNPLSSPAPPQEYVATLVAAGTAGATAVPAYTGATSTVLITWQAVHSADSFTRLLATELDPGKAGFANLDLRPLLLKIVGALGAANTVVQTIPADTPTVLAPTVTGFLPGSALVGASVTLTGTRFTGATAVLFNGTPASFQVLNASTILAVVPPDATSGTVAVTTAGGTGTSAASFTVQGAVVVTPPASTAPTLTGFSPASAAAGASVTLTGTNFTGATAVLFNGTAASFTVLNATTATATVPAQATSGPLALATPAGTGTSTASFTVAAPNRIPVADAGQDLTIQLPTSSVALMGTESDPDSGDTLTPAWRQVTGPNTATGLPATTLNVVASGLVPGTYQFGFRATDNHGAQSVEDYVVVTVQDASAVKLDPPANLQQVGSTSTAAVFSWSSVANAAGYRLRVNGGTTYLPGSATTYTLTGLAPSSSFYAQVQAIGATGYADSDYSAQAAGSTQAAQSTTLALTSADYGQNANDASSTQRYALADLLLTTDATALKFGVENFVPAGLLGEPTISLFDAAGNFVAKLDPATQSGVQPLTVTLPGTGSRSFRLLEGGSTANNDNTDWYGVYVRTAQALDGTFVSKTAPTRAANVAVFNVDSIGVGDGATNNSRYAYVVRLRQLLRTAGLNWDVEVIGWGARSAGMSLATSAQQNTVANQALAAFANRTGLCYYVDVLGTNDAYAHPADPTTAANLKAAVWDKIYAGNTAAKLISATPLWRGNKDQQNSLGKVLADYAAAFNTAANSRSSYVRVVDCLPWLAQPDFVQTASGAQPEDDLHPSDNGHYKIAQKWYGELTGTAISPYLQVGETVQEDDPRLAYSAGWVRNDTPGPQTGAQFHGGAVRYTNTQGATVNIPVAGRQLQFRLYTEVGSGVFELLCNGNVIAAYTLYSAQTVNNVVITSPVVAQGNNTFVVRKRDADTKNVYIDELYVTDGTVAPTPSNAPSTTVTPTGTLQTIEEDDARITYSPDASQYGTANDALYSGGHGRYCEVSKSPSYSIAGFGGGDLAFHTVTHQIGGNVDVLLEGVVKGSFSQYRAAEGFDQATFTISNLPAGTLTVRPSASGAGQYLFVDSVQGHFT